MVVFIVTGCGKEIDSGTYKAYNIVHDGLEYDETMIKDEDWNVTLEFKDGTFW